jgi:Tol biopolymer transport system component
MRLLHLVPVSIAALVGLAFCACGTSGASAGGGSSGEAGPGSDGAPPSSDDGGPLGDDDGSSSPDAISIQPPVNDADLPTSPDAGPGGPWVAFVSNRLGNFDIYIVHPDGTGLRPLVTESGNDLYPSWSPEGARIVFASNQGDAGTYALFVVDVASGTIAPLITNQATALTKGSFRDNTPSWAPDGSVVYFSSNRSDAGTFDVWSVQPDGGSLKQVTNGTNILGGPVAAPDGTTIALAEAASSTTQVDFITLATKSPAVFTALGDYEPAFAPSGAQLAVTSTRYSVDNPEIVLLGVPGATSPFRLTNNPGVDGEPAFQPGQ